MFVFVSATFLVPNINKSCLFFGWKISYLDCVQLLNKSRMKNRSRLQHAVSVYQTTFQTNEHTNLFKHFGRFNRGQLVKGLFNWEQKDVGYFN